MNTFMTKFDKEFLEIGYVHIGDMMIQLCEHTNYKINLINEDNVKRTFTVNPKEKYLEGVGIKGFFKKYSTPYLLVQQIDENEFKLLSLEHSKKESSASVADPRVNTIILEMEKYNTMGEQWFNLYEYAKLLINKSNNQELQCLQVLNEIQKYQYQIKTVEKIFSQFRGRVLLCDEVGLGKTIEACMAMVEYIMRGLVKKVLILTPASLVEQWYTETKTLFNQDFIRTDDPLFKKGRQESWGTYNKVIASISTAKRKVNADAILEQQYDLIIVDEAHHLKNAKTVAWQFINSLNKKYIFLLTATPVQNSLEELFNLITLLKPGQLRTYGYFKKTFVKDKEGLIVKNPKKLRELLGDVMIRNRRSDVDIKFTKRFATTYKVNLLPEEQKLYGELSEFIKEKYLDESCVLTRFVLKNLQERMGSSFFSLLSSLEKLYNNESLPEEDKLRIACYMKQAQDILDEKRENPKLVQMLSIIMKFDGKVLIFTKYRRTQESILNFLKDKNVKTAQFHGSMLKREKEKQVEYFKSDAKVLVSTEAGGEGRNLQFCNCMINFDLPWNPMAIEQRIGRIHRIGQDKDVYVYNLSSSGTIEHYILELLDKKINMFELAIGEVDMILGDVEEKEDFGDVVMNAWVNSNDMQTLEIEIEKIGEKLIQNKTRFEQIKTIDDKIFSDLSMVLEGEDNDII